MIDVKNIRAEFPILEQKIGRYPFVYLDNAATTQKPTNVIDAINHYYRCDNSNIHRGAHTLAHRSSIAFEDTRKTVKEFINADRHEEIIFTKGTTEGINLIASLFQKAVVKAGDNIVVSAMEHHSNIVPWQMICEQNGAKLRVLPINDKGEMLIDELDNLLDEKTKILSIMYASNVLGTINPVKEIIAKAHKKDIPVLLDAAQAVQHIEIDVQDLDCDFMVFSGHKLYGPTGTGILYGKYNLLDKLPTYHGGGAMIKSVSFEKTTYNVLPFKYEAGTPNIAGIIALNEAIKFITKIGLIEIFEYEHRLFEYALDKMKDIDGIKFIGTSENKTGVISFNIDGIHHSDLGTLLDKMGVAIRTGMHCTEPLMKRLGITGTARISFAIYNNYNDIDLFMEALHKSIKMLKG